MAPSAFLASIIWFESPLYKDVPESLNDFVKGAQGLNGHLKFYSGFQLEDEKVGIWLSVWDSIEALTEFERYLQEKDFTRVAQLNGSVDAIKYTVDNVEELYDILNAPVQEIAVIEPKTSPDTTSELEALMPKYCP